MGIPNITYALFHLPKGTYLWLNISASPLFSLSLCFSSLLLIRSILTRSVRFKYCGFIFRFQKKQSSIKTVPFWPARCWVPEFGIPLFACIMVINRWFCRTFCIRNWLLLRSVAPQTWDFPANYLCFASRTVWQTHNIKLNKIGFSKFWFSGSIWNPKNIFIWPTDLGQCDCQRLFLPFNLYNLYREFCFVSTFQRHFAHILQSHIYTHTHNQWATRTILQCETKFPCALWCFIQLRCRFQVFYFLAICLSYSLNFVVDLVLRVSTKVYRAISWVFAYSYFHLPTFGPFAFEYCCCCCCSFVVVAPLD